MRKFLSYFIDYIWFTLFLISLLFKLNFTLLPMIIALIFVPILYIPIDTIFLRLSSSSIGKSIFSMFAFENKKCSLKTCFISAFKQGIFNQTLLIPVFNILALGFRKKLCMPLTKIKLPLRERIASLFTIIMMVTYSLFSNEMIIQKSKKYFVTQDMPSHSIPLNESWIQYKDPTLNFSLLFPSSAGKTESIINIPKSSRVLSLTSLETQNNNITYNVTHTKLPKSWVKWSDKLVLNASLKAITSYENGKILEQHNYKMQKKNIVAYTVLVGKTIKKGHLLLDKNMLYKIQGEYKSGIPLDESQKESIEHFIHHFSLNS